MYETFEHTADLGLRVRAPNLDTLFAEAAEALFTAAVEELRAVQPLQRHDVRLEGDDKAFLLFDWLNELLYQYDTKHLLFSRFECAVEENGFRGTAWGEPLDRSRHALEHEIKAIT